MSWSVSKAAMPKETAATDIRESLMAAAYDGPHKVVLEALADHADKLVSVTPDGLEVGFSSYGHIGPDGTGNAEINISFSRPATTE